MHYGESIRYKALGTWQLVCSGTELKRSSFTLTVGASDQADAFEAEASGLPWGITRCI